jgi:hypothetical protein
MMSAGAGASYGVIDNRSENLQHCSVDHSLRRVRSLRFRSGGMVLFIPWRVGDARRAGLSPNWRPRRRRFLFGFIGWWPARPS